MPTSDQQSNVSSAIAAVRNAQALLTQQIRNTGDTLTAIKLSNEYDNLDSYLSQLLHAQNSADDASFTSATSILKTQATGLQTDATSIKAIVADVQTAASIVSYITQALAFIVRL
jgi:ABC-type phosphate transport system auxiliary subunit